MSATTGNDTLTGTAGNDVIDLLAGNDSYLGLDGNDSIQGNDGNDTIYGGNGNDTLSGGGPDDMLFGGAGNDLYLIAGIINGMLTDSSGSDTVSMLGGGVDTTSASAGDLDGGLGIEAIDLAGTGHLLGLTAAAVISVSDTDMLRVYGSGNDSLVFEGTGWVRTGSSGGFDTLSNAGGNATVIASTGLAPTDIGAVVNGGDGNDTLGGGNGADTIDGGNGSDIIAGSGGNDSILGGNGADSINGGDGADTVWGGLGNDWLQGGNGNDSLFGGDGDDTLSGNAGNDFMVGGLGADSLDGGIGGDTVSYFDATAGVTIRLDLGFGIDGLGNTDFITGIEAVIGSGFNDVIVGSAGVSNFIDTGVGDDVIYGEGADTIIGGAGTDVLFGGSGGALNINLATAGLEVVWGSVAADFLDGRAATVGLTLVSQGTGNDTLLGGSGADFVYFQAGDSILGGAGSDWAVAALSASGVTLNISDRQFGNAWGSAFGGDTISASGSAVSVVIVGDAGNDLVTGGNGTDFLYGFGDNDTLVGGGGGDNLSGGAGNDVFRYNSSSFGADLIWDFSKGADRIDMASSGVTAFTGLTVSVIGGHSVVTSGATGSSEIWVLNTTGLAASDFIFV